MITNYIYQYCINHKVLAFDDSYWHGVKMSEDYLKRGQWVYFLLYCCVSVLKIKIVILLFNIALGKSLINKIRLLKNTYKAIILK